MKRFLKAIFLSSIIISFSYSMQTPKCGPNELIMDGYSKTGVKIKTCFACDKDKKPNKDKTQCICKDPNSVFVLTSIANAQFNIGKCVPKNKGK